MQFTLMQLVRIVRISVTLLTPTEIRVEWPPSKDNLASSRDSPSLLPFFFFFYRTASSGHGRKRDLYSLQCTTHTCRVVIVLQWIAASCKHFSSVPSTNVRKDLGFFHCCQLRDGWREKPPAFLASHPKPAGFTV